MFTEDQMQELKTAIRTHVRATPKEDWEKYFYNMASQDAWSEVTDKFPELNEEMERVGVYPPKWVCDLFSTEEIEWFGKSVDAEI